jgi:hypothetical protein
MVERWSTPSAGRTAGRAGLEGRGDGVGRAGAGRHERVVGEGGWELSGRAMGSSKVEQRHGHHGGESRRPWRKKAAWGKRLIPGHIGGAEAGAPTCRAVGRSHRSSGAREERVPVEVAEEGDGNGWRGGAHMSWLGIGKRS